MNIATGAKGTRLLTGAAYTALFLAGVVQGLIGSFQYSRLVPVAAIGFCVLLLATCLLGAWAMRSAIRNTRNEMSVTAARTAVSPAIASQSPAARPALSMVAVIAPGPAMSGMASGKAAMLRI